MKTCMSVEERMCIRERERWREADDERVRIRETGVRMDAYIEMDRRCECMGVCVTVCIGGVMVSEYV